MSDDLYRLDHLLEHRGELLDATTRLLLYDVAQNSNYWACGPSWDWAQGKITQLEDQYDALAADMRRRRACFPNGQFR